MQTQRPLTIEEICNKLRPVFGKKVDDIYLKYAMADSKEERDEIAQILYALYKKHLNELLDQRVLLEPPKRGSMNGEYGLAKVGYAGKKLYDFNLREQDWIRHVCITGMSGSGKTTMGFHIIKNFIEKGKPFLIFDWKKSFRPLITIDSEIMNFTVGEDRVANLFKMNINKPPKGVSPKEWINVLCDLLTECFAVSYGVHKVLLETLDEAFKEWGIYNGSQNYPTWYHIKWRLDQKMQKTSGREGTWLESAARIATVLTFGSFGKVVNYKGENNMDVEDLLDKKVIFELNALGSIEKKFFCEFILTYIYKLRKAKQNFVANQFEHAILVDEAHNIFLKRHTTFANESVTDMIYREMREYGTSLICLDQHISKLSDTVKGNSACHIAFQQQLPQDIQDISGITQLVDRKEYFTKLPVGSAIVKLSERHTSPFLIEVDEVGLRTQNISDLQIKQRMDAILTSRNLEQGEDSEFVGEIKNPKLIQAEQVYPVNLGPDKPEPDNEYVDYNDPYEEIVGEPKEIDELRVPKHALYDGELQKVQKLKDNMQEKLQRQEMQAQEPQIQEPRFDYNLANSMLRQANAIVNAGRFIEEQEEKEPEVIEEPEENIIEETTIGQDIEEENPVEQLKQKIQTDFLTERQNVLCDYVKLRLAKGYNMREIEKVLEGFVYEGYYNLEDVSIVINHVLESRFNSLNNHESKQGVEPTLIIEQKPVVTEKERQEPKLYKAENNKNITKLNTIKNKNTDGLTDEQEMFLSFLQANPDHRLSTVEFYKQVGLSARKGTKIKKQLIELGLIKDQEVKYDQGWKKLIRLQNTD